MTVRPVHRLFGGETPKNVMPCPPAPEKFFTAFSARVRYSNCRDTVPRRSFRQRNFRFLSPHTRAMWMALFPQNRPVAAQHILAGSQSTWAGGLAAGDRSEFPCRKWGLSGFLGFRRSKIAHFFAKSSPHAIFCGPSPATMAFPKYLTHQALFWAALWWAPINFFLLPRR
jgi:hypothetical protein